MSSRKDKISKKKEKKDEGAPSALAESLVTADEARKTTEEKEKRTKDKSKERKEKKHENNVKEERKEERDDEEEQRQMKKSQRSSSSVFMFLNQTQIQELKEAFIMIDQNRDGLIDTSDLQAIYSQLGSSPEYEVLKGMVDEAPGPLNFTVFLGLFGEKLRGTDTENTLRDAFSMFDEEGKGKLSAEYVKELLMTVGDQFSKKEVADTWDEAPIEDGMLDYLAFVKIMKGGKEY